MPSLIQRLRHWLEDHNPFEDPSLRSARKRLRESNATFGEPHPQIRHEFGANGVSHGLWSTIKPYAETTEELLDSTLEEIRAEAAEFPYLSQAFLGQATQTVTPEILDETFSAWQRSSDKGRFTSEKVVHITAAAFGEYCNQHLKMRWLIVSDPAGRQLGIRSTNNRVTGWPHSTVRKRIAANEHQFFVTVYESLRRSIEEIPADSPDNESNHSNLDQLTNINQPSPEQADSNDLEDDLSHPIRQVQIFDTVLTLEGGGAYIGMVIASPLDASRRSISRLNQKLASYLESFFSAHGHEQWKTPKEGKMRIYIDIHPDSSNEAFLILEAFERAAAARGVEVRVKKKPGE